jgi:hypothetical protein
VGISSRAARAAGLVALVGIVVAPGIYWDGGVLDAEARHFILAYTKDRGLLESIFDPRRTDWGLYQARELSYLFDYVDAKVWRALQQLGWVIFVPLSSLLGSGLLAFQVLRRGRELLPGAAPYRMALLLALFSNVVVFFSNAVYYRSAKILLAAALVTFALELVRVLRNAPTARTGSLMAAGLVMSLLDRQGFFFLLCSLCIVLPGWLRDRARLNRLLACIVATVALATLYNLVLGPILIRTISGYWPSFEYQRIPLWTALTAPEIHWRAVQILSEQARLFLGNGAWPVSVLLLCAGAVDRLRRRRSSSDGIALLSFGLVIVLLHLLVALMVFRHPPVFEIPDHHYWYYFLTVQVVFFLLLVFTLEWLQLPDLKWLRVATVSILLALVANNLRQYDVYRDIAIRSSWFGESYRQTRLIAEALETGVEPEGLDKLSRRVVRRARR